MTETSPVTHFQTENTSEIGSCGFPIPNTLSKIIDVEAGKALGPNEVSIFLIQDYLLEIYVHGGFFRMLGCTVLKYKGFQLLASILAPELCLEASRIA